MSNNEYLFHDASDAAELEQALMNGIELEPNGDEDTHYRAREMTARDPDGRVWSLQAARPPSANAS